MAYTERRQIPNLGIPTTEKPLFAKIFDVRDRHVEQAGSLFQATGVRMSLICVIDEIFE